MAQSLHAFGHTFGISSTPKEGTATYLLGDASDGLVGTFAIQVWNRNAMSAVINVLGRTRLSQANDDNAPFLQIPYLALYLNGAVGTYGYSVAPITGDSIIMVPASGLQIALDVVFTSGVGRVYWTPLEGAAA